MRKSKEVNLGDKKIIISEIQLKHVDKLKSHVEELSSDFSFQKLMNSGFDVATMVSGTTKEQLLELSFSEIDELEIAFKEVNASFLKRAAQTRGWAQKFGIEDVVKTVLSNLKTAMMTETTRTMKYQKEIEELQTSVEQSMTTNQQPENSQIPSIQQPAS